MRGGGPGLSVPCVRPSGAPLRGSGPGTRGVRYEDGRTRGRDRQQFRACEGSRQGLPLPQLPPFQGCVGRLPSRCTTGVGGHWVWGVRGRMPTSSTEATVLVA